MKLLPIIFALSFFSMTEGANLRSVNKQAPVSKGSESPIEGSLRQILDDNNDEAWDRELKKKSVKAKKKKGGKDKKKKGKKKMKKKKQKKSKKKSNKGLNKKQKRNCQRNPTKYSYCPLPVMAADRLLQLNLPSDSRRKLQTNESNLSEDAMGALQDTIRDLLDPPLNVISVTIISITAEFLVTYNVELNLPQGTSESDAQSIVDDALKDVTDEEFQGELQDNLSGLDDCGDGIDCSDLGDSTLAVLTSLSPTSSPSSSPSKAPTGAPSKAPTSSPSSSPTTSAPTPEVSEDDLTPSPSPSGSNSASPSPSPESTPSPSPSVDPLTPSPSPSIDPLIESTADGEVIPWEQDRYLV